MNGDIGQQIQQELVRLRQGWGLQASGLRSRLGPRLSAAGGVHRGDDDKAIRDKATALVRRHTAGFPPDLKLAAAAALGIEDRAWFPTLTKRLNWMATELSCSDRSARRWADDACSRLAEALRRVLQEDRKPDPERGWQLSQLSALLCLDRPVPELYEERTIVAVRDGLAEIQTQVSLPLPADGGARGAELGVDVLFGVTLRQQEQLRGKHYRHTLTLPRALRYGEEHTYKVVYTIPPQRMLPHYAFVPFAACDSFQVRVRFDPQRLPRDVWQLDRVAPRLLDGEDPAAVRLTPDPAGDVSLGFADLLQGRGYGVAWRPGLAGKTAQ